MDIDSYVQNGERTICRAETTTQYGSDGTLVATDIRLVFLESRGFSDDRVLDIANHRVDEIEYHGRPIPWALVILGALAAVVGTFLWLLSPGFIPSELVIPIALLLFTVGAFLFVFAVSAKERLIIKTPSDTHRFVGGGLSNFPHAIRASSSP